MNIDQALIALCEKHDLVSLDVGVSRIADTAPWFTSYAQWYHSGERLCRHGSMATASEAIAHAIQQVNEARACVVEVPAIEMDVAA